jgi:glycine/D-amino acid oxidase-like deaminating enzyme
MSRNYFDFLLVGQGLAGTNLAWHLTRAGKSFLLIGDSSLPSSSRVAAGILNPLTGKKLVKTWMADELFPYAFDYYKSLEKELDSSFLHPIHVYRPYRSLQEQNFYLAQSAESNLCKYIDEKTDTSNYANSVNAPYGGLRVKEAGWLDIPEFLDNSKCFFESKGQYQEAFFNIDDLEVDGMSVCWKDFEFGKVILCQGVRGESDPYFNWLPFNPVKGQVLDVTISDYRIQDIINQGIFVLPIGANQFKVGATYSWHDLDWEATEDGRNYLEEKLHPLLLKPYEITSQRAGIRPSSKDRRPLIGIHPGIPNVGIFNGMGTKGVTLSPYFAGQFVEHLLNGKDLNPSVNIERYFSLYFHSSKS